jgi:hypothetical protein
LIGFLFLTVFLAVFFAIMSSGVDSGLAQSASFVATMRDALEAGSYPTSFASSKALVTKF